MRGSYAIKSAAALGLFGLFLCLQAQAATPSSTASVATTSGKPAWLSDASVSVKEAYDDNIYLVSGLGAAERSSWILTVTPKIGVNFIPLLGQPQGPWQTLSLSYAPDYVSFAGASTESFTAHRVTAALKAKSGPITAALDNGFVFIDGDATAPVYSTTLHDDQRSAYATAAPRERRRQLQDRAKVSLQYDAKQWFARAVGNLILYDLMSDLSSAAGYQNYADRFDVNGGADVGYKILPKVALTLGYRYGREYQQQFPTAIDKTHTSATSNYQRVLVGVEGKLADWITVSLQLGPDYRRYPATTTVHTTPMANRHPRQFYAEGSVSIVASKVDTIDLKGKQWVWVSSTGKIPYVESTYDLAYKHKFDAHLALDLGLRYGQSNYTIGTGTSALRNDRLYAGSCGVTYAFTAQFSAAVAYAVDLGRNGQDNLSAISVNPDWREFDHHLVSGSVAYKF